MSAFEKLHKDIQKCIWDLKWDKFRKIQEDAIELITESKNDVIISAPTASGKTEAAFLPILSKTREALNSELKILYISPLKALINDQFKRVGELCKNMDITITKWHGDANYSKKKKLIKSPKGIVLITPESLESLLINRGPQIRSIFKNLDYVIIDEIHSFVGAPRGDQLKSVINRIERQINRRLIKISLSATVGDINEIIIWHDSKDSVKVISDTDTKREIKGSIRCFTNEADYYESLKQITTNGKNLFFANAKVHLELVCEKLKEYQNNDILRVHHGSLAKEFREEIESELKKSKLLSVFCTNTLELGIDIGDIKEVVMLSAPWSVSSFRQRIGRSGRLDGEAINFHFSLLLPELNKNSHPLDKLRIELVKSIAITELMLEEWCEPNSSRSDGYSTFIHQIIAYLAQRRVASAEEIYKEVCQKSFKGLIDESTFILCLKTLAEKDIIIQLQSGELLLGKEGDLLTENYEFYSVFFSPKEWKVMCGTRDIGTIPLTNLYKKEDHILFGGRKWKVVDVDYDEKQLVVEIAKGGVPPKFDGGAGLVHPKIHEKMLELYSSRKIPYYLNEVGKKELIKAYDIWNEFQEDNSNILEIFKGTKVKNTLYLILRANGINFDDYEVCFYFPESELKSVFDTLARIKSSNDIEMLLKSYKLESMFLEKYDYLLPRELVLESYKNKCIDIDNSLKFIKELLNSKKKLVKL